MYTCIDTHPHTLSQRKEIIDLKPLQSAIESCMMVVIFRCMQFKKYELSLGKYIKMLLVEWVLFLFERDFFRSKSY